MKCINNVTTQEEGRPIDNLKSSDEETIGTIFNIQHYSVQDGPGIRTTVFFKGCNLKCAWCSNPESQLLFPQVAHRVSLCAHCGTCIKTCELNAIQFCDKGIKIDREKCTNCGSCSKACPNEALIIYGEGMAVDKVCADAARDGLFYRNSDGGVTASGGEPLLQPTFLKNLLSRCQAMGIHTALETAGCVDASILPPILEHTELVLYDLKCMDAEIHRKYTGISNVLILENAKYIASLGKRIIFRVPLIGGVNDSVENITKTCEFAVQLHVNQVDLLPYHKYGLRKYASLDRREPDDFSPPSQEHTEKLVSIITNYGLKCEIGG